MFDTAGRVRKDHFPPRRTRSCLPQVETCERELIIRTDLASESTDALETRLVDLEAVIARARSLQVDLLRELDVRQVPMVDGRRSLAEWIVSRMDVAAENAASISRLVHSDSEQVDIALAAGYITADRAVELTRLDSDESVADAEPLSIPRLRSHIASRRRFSRHDERSRPAERFLMLQPTLDQTGLRLWGELVGIDAARFEQTITDAADQISALPSGRREPRKARMADALVNLVTDAATGTTEAAPQTLVSILVDATEATTSNGETGVVTLTGLRVGPDAPDPPV